MAATGQLTGMARAGPVEMAKLEGFLHTSSVALGGRPTPRLGPPLVR